MPRAVRRRMTTAVDLVRETQAMLGRRQVADTAVLALALSFIEAADDLATDIASPDPTRARDISASVRTCIASIGTEEIRGDTSGVDAIVDETSRSICVRQLPMVDLVHLVAAVVQGVEEGLRGLVLSAGVANRRARDGPSSSQRPSAAPVRVTAKGDHVTDGGSIGRSSRSIGIETAVTRTEPPEPIRSSPMTPDYEDP